MVGAWTRRRKEIFFLSLYLLLANRSWNTGLGCDGFPLHPPLSALEYQARKRQQYRTKPRDDRVLLCSSDWNFSSSSSTLYSQQSADDCMLSIQLSIEYCSGCRWGLRSFWMAQELLSRLENEPWLIAVTLIPSKLPSPGGEFIVKSHRRYNTSFDVECATATTNITSTLAFSTVTLWDRKKDSGFPEIEVLEQAVRDQMYTSRTVASSVQELYSTVSNLRVPHIVIQYSTEDRQRLLLRACYYAQELMATFETDLGCISLVPLTSSYSSSLSSSVHTNVEAFVVAVLDCSGGNKIRNESISWSESNDQDVQVMTEHEVKTMILWDRTVMNGFPPKITDLKQRVRDVLAPTKDLGHSNVISNSSVPSIVDTNEKKRVENTDDMDPDPDEAEKSRRFFGVM